MTTTNPTYTNYFRRRTIGRAASPPTFACYEQRGSPYDNDDDLSDDGSEDNVSCSEDGEDYGRHESDSETDDHVNSLGEKKPDNAAPDDVDMEIDEGDDGVAEKKVAAHKKDVKGKQRAIDPEPESPKRQSRQKKPRQPVYTLRPILTIQRSQGFVWNQVSDWYPNIMDPYTHYPFTQDLFVPPYIKDRCSFHSLDSNATDLTVCCECVVFPF